jgi:hypothetical protein
MGGQLGWRPWIGILDVVLATTWCAAGGLEALQAISSVLYLVSYALP